MQLNINYIDKQDFLIAYKYIKKKALFIFNICNESAITELILY